MVIYVTMNQHTDLPGKPLTINMIEVKGHLENHDQCVAISTLMQMVGFYLISQGYDVFKRSHDEHSQDNDVSMTLYKLDQQYSSVVDQIISFLIESLTALALEFSIEIKENVK